MSDEPTKNDRQERIDAAIAACTECGGREFPKRSDCDGCISAVDEELAREAARGGRMSEVAKLNGSIAATSPDLIKEIAMDIGKDVVAYIEIMYPEAIRATSSTFRLAVRNSIYNNILAALEGTDEDEIRNRLATHKSFRRQQKAAWKHIRETDWEKRRAAKDV